MKKYYELIGRSARAEDMNLLHPTFLIMFAWTNMWCFKHGVTPAWTSLRRTVEENKKVGAKSNTHVDGRAGDLSFRQVWGWTEELKDKFKQEFYEEFKDVGALSKDKETGEFYTSPIVGEEEGHNHFHLQCRPKVK